MRENTSKQAFTIQVDDFECVQEKLTKIHPNFTTKDCHRIREFTIEGDGKVLVSLDNN